MESPIISRCRPKRFLLPVWALIVVIPFFWKQGVVFQPLLASLICIGKAAWFWFLIMGLGWRLLKFFSPRRGSDSTGASLSGLFIACGLGLGIFSAFILIWGTWVGVGPKAIFVLMILLILAVGPGWLSLIREIGSVFFQLKSRSWTLWEIAAIGLALGIALLQLPAALVPTLYPDTWRYHFGLTRFFQQEGRIRVIPDFAEANMASTWQMVYLPLLTLCGDTPAQVFNWMTLPLVALVAALALGGEAGGVAALTLVSTPVLLGVAPLANNDLGAALFAALTWLVFFREIHPSFPRSRRWSEIIPHPSKWLLAGIFTGLAVSTKYTSASLFIGVFLGLVFFEPARREMRFRGLVLFCLGAFLGYLPWFIRNGLGTGDPFYPMLGWGSFHDESRWIREHYQREIMAYGDETRNIFKLLLLPWNLTMGDRHYFEIGPGLIYGCMTPLILWTAWNRPSSRLVIGAAFLGGLTWSLVAQVSRFMAPLIPSAAIAVGLAWREWPGNGKGRQLWGLGLFLVAINVWQTMTALAGFSDPWHYLLQGQKHDEYLLANSSLFRTSRWIRQNEPGAKVLLLGEEGIFVMENPFKLSGPFDRKWWVEQAASSGSFGELNRRLHEEGIGLLLVNEKNMEGFEHHFGYASWPSPQVEKNFKNFLEHHAPLVHQDGAIRVYRVN